MAFFDETVEDEKKEAILSLQDIFIATARESLIPF